MCLSGGGQTDKELKCCDLETQTSLWSFSHGGSVRGIDCNERVCVSGSLDGRVRLFDLRTGSVSSAMRLSTSTIHSVQFGKCFLGFGFLLKDFCKWKRSTIGSSFQLEDLRIPCILVKNWLLIEKLKKKKNSSKVTFGFSMKICTKLCSTRTGFLRWLHLRTMWSVAITTVSFLSLQFGIRNEKCFQNRVVKRFDVDGVFQNGFFLLNFCFEDSQHCKLLLQFVFLWLQIVGRVSKV